MSRAVTAKEAAAEIGVDERTVRRWIAGGVLRAEKHGGAFVIALDDVRDAYRKSRAARVSDRTNELAELRGRYLELSALLERLEAELLEEQRRAARLEAKLDARAA